MAINISDKLMFVGRKGNPIEFNIFGSSKSKKAGDLVAQPGAGQTMETREDWLRRIGR